MDARLRDSECFQNFNISANKQKYSIITSKSRSRSKSKDRNKSKSQDNYDFYYLKYNPEIFKTKSNLRRSTISYKSWISKKNRILYKYQKSPETLYKRSSSIDSNKLSQIKSNKFTCSILQQSNNQSIMSVNKTLKNYTPIQKYERYKDILREVKKILKNDIISKRKLKYIFKKQHMYLSFPHINFRSENLDEIYIPDTTEEKRDDLEELKFNTADTCKSDIDSKSLKNVNNKSINPVKSIIPVLKIPKNDVGIINDKIISSTVLSNVCVQTNIKSRTPSPALPLIRDEAILNRNTNQEVRQLSVVKEINVTEKLSDINLKLYKNFKYTQDCSNYLEIKNKFLNTSKSHSSTSIINSSLCNNNMDSSSINKTNINVKQTFSYYQLSSSVQPGYAEHLSPLRITSSSGQWSPILLFQNNDSNLLMNNDMRIVKSSNEPLENSAQSSPTRFSSISDLSKPTTAHLSKRYNSTSSVCRTSRSMSYSKTSRSISRSISRNSTDVLKRSCSKDSTFVSSTRITENSYSNSSRSTSSVSNRTSRRISSTSSRSRSPSIPRRYGSPSFLDRRRITSARKRPVPYRRLTPSSPSSRDSSNYSHSSDESYRSTPSYSSPLNT